MMSVSMHQGRPAVHRFKTRVAADAFPNNPGKVFADGA
jgi:hypothetical protein